MWRCCEYLQGTVKTEYEYCKSAECSNNKVVAWRGSFLSLAETRNALNWTLRYVGTYLPRVTNR